MKRSECCDAPLLELETEICSECGEHCDSYDPNNPVYRCEQCGVVIDSWDNEGGVCAGPCERELCRQCGDWDNDEEGECPKCRKGRE